MDQIQTDLNTKGECIIQKIANLEHSAMFLKLIKNHVDPQLVQSFDVPVFLINPNDFEIDDWDLTTQQVNQKLLLQLFKNIFLSIVLIIIN